MTEKIDFERRRLIKGLGALAGLAVAYPITAEAKRKLTKRDMAVIQQAVNEQRQAIQGYADELEISLGLKQPPKIVKNKELAKKNQDLVTRTIEATKDGTLALVVNKLDRELFVYQNEKLQDTFPIGRSIRIGDKVKRGDKCTPEGEFYVCYKNPKSKYFLSLLLSYPNLEDAIRGRKSKLISRKQHRQIKSAIENKIIPQQYTKLGGQICIHGNGLGLWTHGCVALTNNDMKTLYDKTGLRTPVTIVRYI
jgi:murein L,D-transpeptidase YafK